MPGVLKQKSASPSFVDDVNDCVEIDGPFPVDSNASVPGLNGNVVWSIANPFYEEEVPHHSSLSNTQDSATDPDQATVEISLYCNNTPPRTSKKRHLTIPAESEKPSESGKYGCQNLWKPSSTENTERRKETAVAGCKSRHATKPTNLICNFKYDATRNQTPASPGTLFDVHQGIGAGGEGTVYSGTRVCDGLKVALKFLPKENIKRYGLLNGCKVPVEFDLLHRASGHPGIIKMVDWYEDSDSYVLVMERHLGMVDLWQLSCDYVRFPENIARSIFKQLAKAVLHCHSNGVVHRDIKLDNVLVNPTTFEIKLIDFGCGTKIQDSVLTKFAGTELFYPPEWFTERRYYGKRIDVWCLGIALYVMVEGRLPFKKTKDIVKCKPKVRHGNRMSRTYRHLIGWMLAYVRIRTCDLPSKQFWPILGPTENNHSTAC